MLVEKFNQNHSTENGQFATSGGATSRPSVKFNPNNKPNNGNGGRPQPIVIAPKTPPNGGVDPNMISQEQYTTPYRSNLQAEMATRNNNAVAVRKARLRALVERIQKTRAYVRSLGFYSAMQRYHLPIQTSEAEDLKVKPDVNKKKKLRIINGYPVYPYNGAPLDASYVGAVLDGENTSSVPDNIYTGK